MWGQEQIFSASAGTSTIFDSLAGAAGVAEYRATGPV